MKVLYNFLFLLTLFSFYLLTSCESNQPVDSTESTNNEHYIVLLKLSNGDQIQSTSSVEAVIKRFLTTHNIDLNRIVHIYTTVVQGFSAMLTPEELKNLEKDPNVKLIEKDKLIALDPVEVIPDNSKNDAPLAQTTPWGIRAVGGFANGSTLTRVAWIVDTGIDLDHPDLNVSTSRSRTFVRTGRDSRTADDLNGHGTHVAGTIAAKNNSIGVVGVAAGATVIAVKVLNQNGSGYVSDIVSGLDYVAQNGNNNDVVNLSLGGGASTTLDNAIVGCANAGLIVCIAAGNSSAYAGNYSPARVNGTNIYTVSAHDSSDIFATFSNYGNPPIDYCAPGVRVYSTYKSGRYATMSGTSMATPHVAGILLINGGTIYSRGYVSNDPDGTADPLASRQ